MQTRVVVKEISEFQGRKTEDRRTFHLAEKNKSRLAFANRELKSPSQDFPEFAARSMVSLLSSLPVELIRVLLEFRRNHHAPGDLLIINNRKAVHGRTPFKPRFDGLSRRKIYELVLATDQ